MTSRHLVDPELLTLIDTLPSVEFALETVAETRAQSEQMLREMSAVSEISPGINRSERVVPGPKRAPDVRVLVYQPKSASASRAAYLHIHGGGYVIGSPEMGDPRNSKLANELDCVVVSVDYRLAPETVFPGAVEDCYAALKWLLAHAEELGVDRNRIAIGGESAGGGLAAALGLLTRDRGEVPIIHQQLVYPMMDDRPATEPHPYTGEFVWRHKENYLGWKALLGREPGGEGVSPYAAAARAENLAGLPPTFISTGALDLFLEENLDYARRLTRAGVPVELHVYPGAFHGFDMAFNSRLAQKHARDQLDALRNALTKPA